MTGTGLVLRTLRVKQWTKNVLVFAAPVTAGVITDPKALAAGVSAFFSFSLLASALYVVNDIRDAEADRLHPRKKWRPIAAGDISLRTGTLMGMIAAAGSLALALLYLPVDFLWVMGAYAANTLFYTSWGKYVPTVDIIQVALGFVLRAVAGAVATGVFVSQWFLAAAMFGSLLMVAGKRSSEVVSMGASGETRVVLEGYRTAYLRQVMVIAAAALLLTYATWALGETDAPIQEPWALVSFAPFVYCVLRYVQLSDTGHTEEPETLILSERGLQIGGMLWVATIAIGIYA